MSVSSSLTEPLTRTERRAFLDVAAGIADGLCDAAEWSGDACAWQTPRRRGPSDELSYSTGDGRLYHGSSGVALFLMGLAPHVDAERAELYGHTARGALRHAFEQEQQAPAGGGFYSGTAGVAAAFAEAAKQWPDEPWLDAAVELCRHVEAGPKPRLGLDLISGEAGTILGLLRVYEASGDEGILQTVRDTAEILLDERRLETEGLSWDCLHPSVLANPLGISHGAGGIGLAFLELFRVTGEARYLDPAVEALRYEDSRFDAEHQSWPDLRHRPLASYIEEGRLDSLRTDLADGTFDVADAAPGHMNAWCHGAPGIGLVRARFVELLGVQNVSSENHGAGESYGATLRRCAEQTLPSLVDPRMRPRSHSLCHGLLGNAEALLHMAQVLGACGLEDERHARAAFEVAERARREVKEGGRPWVCGTPDHAYAPGLMTGEAGVGMFYLRLVDPSVPSILLPVSAVTEADRGRIRDARRPNRFCHLFPFHFPRTRAVLETAGLDPRPEELRADEVRSVAELRRALAERVAGLSNPLGPAAREIFALEAELLDRTAHRRSPAERFVAELGARPTERLDDPEIRVRAAPSVRLVTTEHPWPATTDEPAVAAGSTLVIFEAGGEIQARPLVGPAAEMLRRLHRPTTVGELIDGLVESLADHLDPDDPELEEQVRSKLLDGLRQAYEGGTVEIVEAVDLRPSEIDGELCVHCGECCRVKIFVPGDGAYAEFLHEVLGEPLRAVYPELEISVQEAEVGSGDTEAPPSQLPRSQSPKSQTPKSQVVLDLGDCRHLVRETVDGLPTARCSAYGERPEVCRQFNCASWWRRQRAMTTEPSTADRLMERVGALKETLAERRSLPVVRG